MQKLLLHYRNEDQAQVIKSYLESRLPYEVFTSRLPYEIESFITTKSIHLVIYETDDYRQSDLMAIKDMRGLGYAYPVLVLAASLGYENIYSLGEKFKIHFLDKPFEFRALRGVTRKLMTQRTVPQQQHRRFRTNQNTMLEAYLSSEQIASKMYNLSVGGAYFEFDKRPDIVVGDLLRMKINLPDLAREHKVNARVVWTTRKGAVSGQPGCGVRFIKGPEIYKQLMEKV